MILDQNLWIRFQRVFIHNQWLTMLSEAGKFQRRRCWDLSIRIPVCINALLTSPVALELPATPHWPDLVRTIRYGGLNGHDVARKPSRSGLLCRYRRAAGAIRHGGP